MATSGVSVNELTRDQIINAALRKLVVIGEGQTANASQITTATEALNALVAEYRTLGMSLWARKTYLLPMVNGQSEYVFGVGQPINTPYPYKVYSARAQIAPDYETNIEMNMYSFSDFDLLPNGSQGTPVNFMYQPQINKGIFTVWPTPDSSVPANSRIAIDYQAPFEYFVAATDTPDFPEEWKNALIYGLAALLSDEMGTPMQKQAWMEKQADKHLGMALSGGTEEGSIFLQRDWAGEY